jgi:hypothetical protein
VTAPRRGVGRVCLFWGSYDRGICGTGICGTDGIIPVPPAFASHLPKLTSCNVRVCDLRKTTQRIVVVDQALLPASQQNRRTSDTGTITSHTRYEQYPGNPFSSTLG